MPDADILRTKLSAKDNSVYEQICQGEEDEDVAFRLLESLKAHIKSAGMGPLQFIEYSMDALRQIPKEPLFRIIFDINVVIEHLEVRAREIYRTTNVQPQALELAIDACKEIAYQYVDKDVVQAQERDVVECYLRRLYEAKITSRFLAQEQHLFDIDSKVFEERLQNVTSHPYLEKGFQNFSQQIVNNRSVEGLRRPPRSKNRQDDNDLLYMELNL